MKKAIIILLVWASMISCDQKEPVKQGLPKESIHDSIPVQKKVKHLSYVDSAEIYLNKQLDFHFKYDEAKWKYYLTEEDKYRRLADRYSDSSSKYYRLLKNLK